MTEFEKAYKIVEALLQKNENGQKMYPELSWKRLFKKFNFFGAYQHFVMITILSETNELHNKWLGFAESKVRHFVNYLEKLFSSKHSFEFEMRPWSKTYKIEQTLQRPPGIAKPDFAEGNSYFIGIRVKKNENVEPLAIDLSQTIFKYYDFFNNMVKEQMPEME